MSEKSSKKRKRDEENEEEVELEHKRKKKKSKKNKDSENNNNEEEKISEEIVDVDADSTPKKKSKKSKKSEKDDDEGSGQEEKQKKKRRKEKSKKDESDHDQEPAASENNTNETDKKKKKKRKKPEVAEPMEVDEGDAAESSKKEKKKKKKSKAKKGEDEESTNTKADTADEMSETNIATKVGKYSKAENEVLEKKILEYINAQGWEKDEGLDKICNGKIKERQGAWIEIASVLPEREWRSVMAHCRRTFNPDNYKGSWSQEDIERLEQLVKEYKNAWRRIGTELGRLPTACRDKWREIKDIDSLSAGKWTDEEDKKLLTALKKQNNGTLPDDDSPPILWSIVCQGVGTRNQDACRARWRKIDPSKQKSIMEWTDEDSKKLLVKVQSMYPQDETEITFSQISKKWTYKVIQVRWKVLLKHAPDYQNKSLPENIKALVKHFELKKKAIKKIKEQIEEEGW